MKILMVALLFPLAAILQSTLLWQALPPEVTLDLCLLLTIFCGLRWGAAGGSSAGLWAGSLMGAMRSSGSLTLVLLYGVAGWLAGMHHERGADRWSYPLVGMMLVVLVTVAEGHLTALGQGNQPSMPWILASLGWHAVACLTLLGARR